MPAVNAAIAVHGHVRGEFQRFRCQIIRQKGGGPSVAHTSGLVRVVRQ